MMIMMILMLMIITIDDVDHDEYDNYKHILLDINIARGTTDPGYWVYNLNHFSEWNKFEIIMAEKDHSSYGLNTLGPLCLWQCFSTFL